jgi:hypothetical protein
MLAHKLDEAPPETPVANEDGAEEGKVLTLFPQWADAPVTTPDSHAETLLDLAALADPEADPGDDPEAWHLPPPGIHTTGSQLRRRLVTPESIAELAAHKKPSLIQRILRRT